MIAFLWLFSGLLGGIALYYSVVIEERHTDKDCGIGEIKDLNLGDITLLLGMAGITALIGPIMLIIGLTTMVVHFFMYTEKGIEIRNYKPFKGEK